MLKVIFFDAAGTLFHLPQGVGHHYQEVLARHGIAREERELGLAFREVWKEIDPPPAGTGPRGDDDRGWWRDVVNRVLDRCGVEPGQLEREPFFQELYAEFVRPAVWKLYPEVREVLETLSARFPLGVITNFDGRYRTIAEQLGIARFFQHTIISSEVGADKPDARIFHAAAQRAGVSVGEALHAGDDPVCDWQGAADAGMRTFALNRPTNSLRDLLTLVANE